MKIWLLNPPFLKKFSRPQRSPAVTKSGTLYYPLWLAYATGVLAEAGYEVELIDAPAAGLDLPQVLERAKIYQPNLIVLDTSTPSIYNDIAVAEKLKEVVPNTRIALVGTHVTALPEQTLELSEKIDYILRGEYEYTLLDLVRLLDDSSNFELRNLNSILGLTYRQNGKIFHTPERPLINDLDKLPFVSKIYKKFLRIEDYFNPNALYPMVTIVSGRGCPNNCIFCVYPQTVNGRQYRYRSIDNVVAEMEYIQQTFPQVKSIFFEDDTLTANPVRCRELADLIQQKKLRIPWTANARADVDFETLQHLKRGGCRQLCVGFESGNQDILNRIRKGLTIDRAKQFMADARKVGILIHGCFMAGNPGETKETLQQTLEYAKELNPDTVQFYPVMVYPGTEAYQWYKAQGYLSTEDYRQWLTCEGLHNCVINLPGLTKTELVIFCDHARRQFYLRPKYIFYKLKQMVIHPQEIRRTLKSLRTFVKYLLFGSFRKNKTT
ncbi:MAG: B12-binding domain-containing radical SAM protein [bacterium]|nr:B12-binding domain-containing radical SAM protein [bacterium]